MAETAKNVHEYDTDEIDGIISKISLPKEVTGGDKNLVYEIHDAKAIHSAADLGLSAALRFVGVVDTFDDLPPLYRDNIGDVYHVIADNYEYVAIEYLDEQFNERMRWEPLGAPHNFVGIDAYNQHTHSFTAPQVTIPQLTGTGEIEGYKATTTKLKATAEDITITEGSTKTSVLKGTASTKISATTGVTPTPGAQKEGTSASWTATVSGGTLTFNWTTNTPSTVVAAPLVGVTANNNDITVSFEDKYKEEIFTSWEASTPGITLFSGESGDVTVATGLATDGTRGVTVKTESRTADVSGGLVGTPTNQIPNKSN